ncbi:hypothetical protein HDV05_001132 [Chytridiales sp. JEL 0842]|nr:hypothetical protein HDV05_001132 [Chytridiales sp. JEL 0842]
MPHITTLSLLELSTIAAVVDAKSDGQIAAGIICFDSRMSLWGSHLISGFSCTDNGDFGCERTSGGGNIINPVQSALLRSVKGFNFRYGKIEVVMQIPLGDWMHTFGLVWTPEYIQTYVNEPTNVVLNVSLSNFWQKGQFPSNIDNPWDGACDQTSFDKKFYLIMNAAAGGISGYFPDGSAGMTWSNTSPQAAAQFWKARDTWYPTWKGDGAAMKVDKVTTWELC